MAVALFALIIELKAGNTSQHLVSSIKQFYV